MQTLAGPAVVLALVAALIATPAVGQAPDSAQRLGEIVVSAERPGSEAAGTVRRVTAADIEAYGARTLDEAIRMLPGVNIRTGADGVPRVDVRGLRTRQVTLLLDGVPLNATSDGQFDPTLIPVEQIAEIKLATGTASMLYGSGGLAGVINIITRSGGGPPAATGRGEWRDSDGWLGRVTGSGGSGPVSGFVSASGFTLGGVPSFAGSPTLGSPPSGERFNSDRDRLNLFGRVGVGLGPRGNTALTLASVTGNYGKPPSVIDDPTDPFANRPVYERVTDLDGLAAQLAAGYAMAPNWSIRGWGYRNLLNELTERFADPGLDQDSVLVQPGTSTDRSRELRTGAAVQLGSTALPVGRITLGLSADRSAWEELLVEAVEPSGGGGGGGGAVVAAAAADLQRSSVDRALWDYGVAMEFDTRPAERLGVVAGATYHWLDGEGRNDGAAGASLGAHFDATPALRLRASYAHRFRFPTLRQFFDAATGNPDLAREEADIFELGADYSPLPTVTFGVTGFHTEADNFIERPQGADRFENADRYRLRGIELEGAYRPAPRVLARARYTWLDAEDRSPGREGTRLQYRPRHSIAAELRYQTRWNLAASGTLRYLAGQVYETRRKPLVQADLPDYALLGLRLEQRLGARPVALYVGVDNLFDQAYEESYGFPQAGRVAYIGLDIGR